VNAARAGGCDTAGGGRATGAAGGTTWTRSAVDETWHKGLWCLFSAAASRTQRIRLGPNVAHVCLHEPNPICRTSRRRALGRSAEDVVSTGNFVTLEQYQPHWAGRKPRSRLREPLPQPAGRRRAHGHLTQGYTGNVEGELPRSVRKGPLITLTCDCGNRQQLRYGERWKCEDCGKTFDTRKIPLEEYASIRRTQLRYRMVPLISGLFLLAGVVLFFAEGKAFGAIIAVPFLFASWNMFVRPFFRTRYRRALTKKAPTWTIDAD
jgi:hypothetical protein